ncbi:MAG: hypothetical protein ACYDEA_13005, partial [Candidatus Dormibacteria bacterium]
MLNPPASSKLDGSTFPTLAPAGSPSRFEAWRPGWLVAVERLGPHLSDPDWWFTQGLDPLRFSPGQLRACVAAACLQLGL